MTTLPRPWSPPHQAQYPQPPTDPRGVENYLASQAQPPQYYDPYAQSGTWQPTPPHPPYAARQASLPVPSIPQYTHGYGHHQQPTDASVEALDLAEYSARLNAQQAQYYTPPPQPSYYTPPASYPAQPASAPPASQPQSSTAQPQSAIHDFIDIGPFSYTGIRETSPPPVRPPPAQPQPQPRQTREPSPVHSPPPRGHLPWASETNERDLGDRDPDPVFPPSSPHRNDSHNFPFNVQSESAPTATSETLAHSAENDAASGYRAYDSPDPESLEPKKDWGVTEGERPGDVGADGKLISNGPRKRMALRALEVVAAIGSVVACIYAFAVPKPNPAAPPASKPAVYVIVVLGFATIFVFVYVYIIRGLFGVGRPKDDAHSHAMVLPISRHRANSKKNKQSSVQVNLIVDPSYFSPKHEITPGVPWTEQQKSNAGVFTSYERERARLSARKGLWWALGLDVLGALAWGTAFVLAMIGPRCPVGGYSGWCDAFNGAVACACIGCALFVASGVLVGRDLMVSRRSDRKLGRQ